MRCYGLIGYPLSHSFSMKYFTDKFVREGIQNCRYDNFPLEHIGMFPTLVKNHKELEGLNVTIPYKERIIPYLNELDEDTRTIGAVNTVKVYRQGDQISLKGYNTDVYGFEISIKPFLTENNLSALILGTGGASKAAAHVLKRLGFGVTFVSRRPKGADQLAYADLTPQFVGATQVIVNTSPVGMFPDTGSCPDLPYEVLTPEHVLFDLIYNPLETLFLAKGREKGAKVINGLQMLHLQAEKSWEIWNTD
jgi:shikimate dehydrogenase